MWLYDCLPNNHTNIIKTSDKKYQKNRVKMLDFSETTFHNIASDSLPREIDEKRLTEIVERAKDFCLMHGKQ